MKAFCNKLQNILAEKGAAALTGNKAACEHLESCQECRAIADALSEIENTLSTLPEREPPVALVHSLKQKINNQSDEVAQSRDVEHKAEHAWNWFVPRIGLGVSGALASVLAVFIVFRQVGDKVSREMRQPMTSVASVEQGAALGGAISAKAPVMKSKQDKDASANFENDGKLLGADSTLKIENEEQTLSESDLSSETKPKADALRIMKEESERERIVDQRYANVVSGFKQQSRSVADTKTEIEEHTTETAKIFKKMIERLEESADELPAASKPFKAEISDIKNEDEKASEEYADRYQQYVKNLNRTVARFEDRVAGQRSSPVPVPLMTAEGKVTGPSGYVTGKAVSGGAQTFASIIGSRINQISPMIQVLSGRESVAVFSKSAQSESDDSQRVDLVAPGDTVKVKLLTGVNAPTDGTPYPIVFKVLGANKDVKNSNKILEDSRIIAYAQGSLTDSRVLFRLSQLNLRYKDGIRKTIDIDGWIVGEDGIRGMEGTVIDPIGAAKAAITIASPIPSKDEFLSLMSERETINGLTFRSAQGYFSNTYIPGDPIYRTLKSRLDLWDRKTLGSEIGKKLDLENALLPATQPFDAPRDAALALYVNADRSLVNSPSRMLLQVGIKATDRKNALRQPIALALLIDLRAEADVHTQQSLRAIVEALSKSKHSGDQFRLSIIGRGSEGVIEVKPEDFRHGPLTIALSKAFASKPVVNSAVADVLKKLSAELTKKSESGNAVGNSSIVIVGEGKGFADTQIRQAAEASALAGVPVSVIGVGSAADISSIDRLVLIGQGSRRILTEAKDAQALIEREIHAQAQVVAKALRLNIKLKPGVKLVNIVGTESLDSEQTKQVKYIEETQDQKLAKDFGIEADRGDDEAGIQILIPAFYSGDSHVVLLDVVVDGATTRDNVTSLAEVSLRFKDLLELKNGRVEKSFSLPSIGKKGSAVWSNLTTLDRNVVKNFLSSKLSVQLKKAAIALQGNNKEIANTEIRKAREIIQGAFIRVSGLSDDQDLKRIESVLDQYYVLLQSGAAERHSALQQLSESMQLAGHYLQVPLREGITIAK